MLTVNNDKRRIQISNNKPGTPHETDSVTPEKKKLIKNYSNLSLTFYCLTNLDYHHETKIISHLDDLKIQFLIL